MAQSDQEKFGYECHEKKLYCGPVKNLTPLEWSEQAYRSHGFEDALAIANKYSCEVYLRGGEIVGRNPNFNFFKQAQIHLKKINQKEVKNNGTGSHTKRGKTKYATNPGIASKPHNAVL